MQHRNAEFQRRAQELNRVETGSGIAPAIDSPMKKRGTAGSSQSGRISGKG